MYIYLYTKQITCTHRYYKTYYTTHIVIRIKKYLNFLTLYTEYFRIYSYNAYSLQFRLKKENVNTTRKRPNRIKGWSIAFKIFFVLNPLIGGMVFSIWNVYFSLSFCNEIKTLFLNFTRIRYNILYMYIFIYQKHKPQNSKTNFWVLKMDRIKLIRNYIWIELTY